MTAGAEESDAREWLRAVVADQRTILLSNGEGVHLAKPKAVHRTRVAARRLRSLLSTYETFLPGVDLESLTDELQWLGVALSASRDQEVVRSRLLARVHALPADLVIGPVEARVAGAGTRMVAAAMTGPGTGAADLVDRHRYDRLVGALDHLVTVPVPGPPPGPGPLPESLVVAVRRSTERLHRAMAAADRDAGDTISELSLHTVRKRAKVLRYSLEPAVPVLGAPARRVVRRATEIHHALGDVQDSVVARAHLRDLASDARGRGESEFTYGLLHGLEDVAAERAVTQYEEVRPRLERAVDRLLTAGG